MFVWIGCKLPWDFEQEIRTRCLELNRGIGLDTAAFSLPQHISLKISFETKQPEAVLEDLSAWLGEQTAFAVHVRNPEQAGNILWLPVAENPHLKRLHQQLDHRLEQEFNVPQHPFDKQFLFHSTLFIDEDAEKITAMLHLLADDPMERELLVDTFLLGLSETGKAGSYRVVRQIKV
jgi:2'-5' RNA ligase